MIQGTLFLACLSLAAAGVVPSSLKWNQLVASALFAISPLGNIPEAFTAVLRNTESVTCTIGARFHVAELI